MSDTRNVVLAWTSSITSAFAAIEFRDLIAIVSAIVLPMIFFTIGKTIDVLVQIHLRKDRKTRDDKSE